MNPFPVTESTLSARHLGDLLQERYALGKDAVCTLFRTGMNHLYMVRDGKTRFVLRIYTHGWRTYLEIAEELRLLRHLKENDIPVAYPIADREGEFIQKISAPEGIRYGVLFSYAEGRKVPRFSAETSYHIGIAMARMHRATENFALQRTTYDAGTLLADSLHRTKAFFTNPTDEMAYVEKLTDYLIHEYVKADASRLRQGAVHLDIWFDNIHLKDEHTPTFFDFDFCGNGWLCLDISYFLYQLYNTNLEGDEYQRKADSFLKGYESITPLTEEEKRLLPMGCLCVMLYYLSMQCEKYDTWSNIFLNEDHLKRFVGALKRWVAFQGVEVVGN